MSQTKIEPTIKNSSIYYGLRLIILTFTLLGCRSGFISNDADLEYWYFPDNNTYFSINYEGNIEIFYCSLTNGFVLDKTMAGLREEDTVIIYIEGEEVPEQFNYSLEEQYISFEDGSMSFELASGIPTLCNDDAIEITSISPTEAYEGVETEFTVEFDYHLTKEEAVVDIGFTSDNIGTLSMETDSSYEISQKGSGSGSITLTHIPKSLEGSSLYYLGVNMSPIIKGSSYVPLAGDAVKITILSK